MTRPKPRRATVTVNSVRSEDNLLATVHPGVLQALYFFLECAPAVRVVLEHVEGGAGGGQEHGVPGDAGEAGPLHRFQRVAQRSTGRTPPRLVAIRSWASPIASTRLPRSRSRG